MQLHVKATLVGYIGLFIWAVSAVLVTMTRSIPTFEILSIVYFISFSATVIMLTLNNKCYLIKQPLKVWLIGTFGIYGNEILYINSFKYAPPAQADLINYLWPILVVLLSGLFLKHKTTIKYYLAVILGFSGIYILLTNGQGLSSFKTVYLSGYLFAFSAAVVWSSYILAIRLMQSIPLEMTGMYYGVGMLMSILMHFQFEKTVIPNLQQWLCLSLMGLTAQGIAYYFWNYGIKYGNFKLLSILSYGNPIISVFCLYLFGFTALSTSLIIACLFVSTGSLIGYYASIEKD